MVSESCYCCSLQLAPAFKGNKWLEWLTSHWCPFHSELNESVFALSGKRNIQNFFVPQISADYNLHHEWANWEVLHELNTWTILLIWLELHLNCSEFKGSTCVPTVPTYLPQLQAVLAGKSSPINCFVSTVTLSTQFYVMLTTANNRVITSSCYL